MTEQKSTDNYIDLSMRYHRSREDPIYYGRFLGEGQMVVAFSNHKWPGWITYPELRLALNRQFFAILEASRKMNSV